MVAQSYSTKEVARLLKISEHVVRQFVHAGVVNARSCGRGYPLRFDFQDLLVLRTAKRLMTDGMPIQRIKRGLQTLQSGPGAPKPVTGLKIFAENGRMMVEGEGRRWEAESGQQYLPLAPPVRPAGVAVGPQNTLSGASEAAARSHLGSAAERDEADAAPSDAADADGWFEVGLSLEDVDPEKAYEAYLKALSLNPEHTETCINVGRLCSANGELQRAAAYFRQAVRLDPMHPVARYNLAVTLHDLGELTHAEAAYRAALENDADFADAHFNLAALLEQRGDRQGALRHLREYHRISGDSLSDFEGQEPPR